MNKFTTKIAAALSFGLVAAGAQADEIRIPVNSWTGQNLSAHIAGQLLEKLDHEVEYVTAGAVPQLAAMAQGTLHFQPEFWDNNVGDIYPDALAVGDIVIVGPLGLQSREGWIYPPYMEEQCPGLPAYEALYDCAQAFAAADTFPNGRLITYPADWGTRSRDLVAALDLPFQPVAGGSEGAMIAELRSAVAAQQPMLMMFWEPHWLFAEFDFNWIEWDAPENGVCDESNQTRGDACGFAQANVGKLVNRDFAETWPDAYALAEAFTMDNASQNEMILQVDQQGMSVEDAAAGWIAENEEIWTPWIEAARAAQD
ncbi:glycine betaine/proline transport system substrate-binding protein [Salinihabitans flavidus]|uniref:Glycine betaine/proline transport system substrate-binding protein n=1 Tax=Salinihabitans flavidus TaxID=569882 RepID=A0A1H8MRP7_9RHOB|nr:ABC transporter substrate-binding protein [Salinihabitans flavidus]SEO20161.1 glycine betaine/proline transport system substrate-binding protein [Salinihabitans flavidus]